MPYRWFFHATRRTARVRAGASQRGFTLVELLVVFAIAAVLISVAPVAYEKARESAQYRNTLRQFASELRQARAQAMQTGLPQVLQVDVAARRFARQGQAAQTVPEGLDVRVTTGESLIAANQQAAIVFLPDGGASGGSIEILRPSGVGARLRVDWLTGQVTQEALLP